MSSLQISVFKGFQCSGPRSEDRRCNQETGGPIEQPDKQWSFGGSGPYGQPQSGGDQYSQQQSNYGSQTASSPPAYINQNPIYNQQATQANSYQQSPTLPQPPPTQSNYNRPQPTSATSYTSDDSSYQSNRHDNYNSQPTGQSYNQPTAQPYNNQQAYNPQPPPATSSYNQPQPTNSYNPGPTPAYTSQPAAYNKPSSSAYNNPQPAPSYSSQPPAYNNPQPTPSYSSQPPTYNKPSISAYNNPQPIPSYSNNQPAEQPSYQAETPAYSQPAGSYPSSQVTNSPPANSYGSQPGAYGPPPSVLQALAYSAIGPQQFQKAIEDQYWASQGINPSGVGNVKYSPARPYVYGESPGPLPAHANTYSSGPASNSGGYGQSAGSYQPSNRGYQATTEPNTLSLSPGYGIQQVLTPTGVVYGKANEGAFAPGFRLQKGFAPGYGPNPNQPGGAARSYGPSGPAAPVPAETSYGSAQAQPSYSGFAPGFRLANPTSQPSSSYGSSGATGVTGVGQPPAFRPDSNDNLPAGAPAFVPQPLNGYGGGSRPSSGPSSYPSGPIKTYSAGSYGPSNILDSQAGGYPPALQPPQPQNSYSPVAPYQPPAQVPRVSYSSYGGKPQTEYRKLDSPISTQTNNTASSEILRISISGKL